MFFNALQLALGLFYISLAVGSDVETDSCGCLAMCNSKFIVRTKQGVESRAACRRGCRLFHLVVKIPHMPAPAGELTKAEDNCAYSCMQALSGEKPLQDACLEGCQAGCETPLNVQPRVKLTILVENDLAAGADGAELEQVLTDPALKKQLEATLASHGIGKTKIPASYFTNLPVARETVRGCGPEPRLCEGWLAGEPLLCAGLLILAAGLLLAAYWRRAPHDSPEQAPMLPEKVPLQLSV